jgi:D-lactate dehydrogenase (cytochrome)
MEHLDRVLWVRGDRARVQGGAILGRFQQELQRQGWCFTPDPTSRHECTIGAAIACNASGAKSFRYGPTRPWVEALEVVLPDGTVREITRADPLPSEWPVTTWQPPPVKSAAGYFPADNLLDLFVGQEGTLGIVTEATLRLIPAPESVFSLLTFFSTLEQTLAFVQILREQVKTREGVSPSSIEFYGPRALDFIRSETGELSCEAKYGIWCEQEGLEKEEDERLTAWLDCLEGAGALVEETLFAQDDAGRARLAAMRHAVPAGINEQVVANGMPKVGTDCSVPPEALAEMMAAYDAVSLPHVLFGHIGDSHLHLNMLPSSAEELKEAKAIYRALCQKAVALGGSISAEHGIGKLKKAHFAEMVGPEALGEFRALKAHLDPNWILGRGNLFSPADSSFLP